MMAQIKRRIMLKETRGKHSRTIWTKWKSLKEVAGFISQLKHEWKDGKIVVYNWRFDNNSKEERENWKGIPESELSDTMKLTYWVRGQKTFKDEKWHRGF